MTKQDQVDKSELFDELGKLLDDLKMQVTVTGWKAELIRTEASLKAALEREAVLREAVERIEASEYSNAEFARADSRLTLQRVDAMKQEVKK